MNTDLKIRQAKLSRWAALFQEQASSGLHVKTWCDQNGISIHAYYYWKRIVKEAYDSVDQMLSQDAEAIEKSSEKQLLREREKLVTEREHLSETADKNRSRVTRLVVDMLTT